jgi:WhiB family redox-sensing transcriptional regulator
MAIPAWRDAAACRGSNPEQFAPVTTTNGDPNEHPKVVAAKRVCAKCPSTTECLLFAVDHSGSSGVWGGEYFDEFAGGRYTQRRRNAILAKADRLREQAS